MISVELDSQDSTLHDYLESLSEPRDIVDSELSCPEGERLLKELNQEINVSQSHFAR
jgi:hypothetical protein